MLAIGLSSYNVKSQVPSDVLENNQYIPPNNLKSQEYLDEISQWTNNQKMVINQKKSKTMIFNYTQKYQFSTRLKIEGEILETVTDAKLLGTILSEYPKWENYTENIVSKANKRTSQEKITFWLELGGYEEYIHALYSKSVRTVLYCLAQRPDI